MRLATLRVRQPTFIGLTADDFVCEALINVGVHVEELADDDDDVDPTKVALAVLVHVKFTAVFELFEEEVEGLAVEKVVSLWPKR
jgi:hypothetical protein